MPTLIDALNARFTDADEIRDVVNHGCSGGVSGFIYSTELCDFFNQYESEIDDWLIEHETNYCDLLPEFDLFVSYTFQQIKEAAVWFVVKTYCQARVDND